MLVFIVNLENVDFENFSFLKISFISGLELKRCCLKTKIAKKNIFMNNPLMQKVCLNMIDRRIT